jgi:signal transduction histidine kinase
MLKNKTGLSTSNPLLASKTNSDELKTASNSNSNKLAWRNWLITKPFDWIATPLYLICNITLIYYPEPLNISKPPVQWWQAVIVLAASFLLLAIDRYEYWYIGEDIGKRMAVGLFLARVVLIQLITQISPVEVIYFLYLIIPFSALLYFGYKVGIASGMVVCVVVAARVFLFPSSGFLVYRPVLFVSLFIISTLLVITTAIALLHEKASRLRTEQLLLELKKSQNQLEELAATRERNRLARDIHDSLGHYLTVINIQLSKAKAYREKNPLTSEQAIDNAKRLANEALQDVRESVRSLRTGQELFSLQKSLPLLVANLQSERLTIDLEMSGSEAGVSKQYLMILYRVAQEGLTNVQRHSGSGWAKVSLKFTPRLVQLTIEDKGKGFEVQDPLLTTPTTGYGLFGLRERVQTVGGQLEVFSQPGGGTRLSATIVLSEDEEDK